MISFFSCFTTQVSLTFIPSKRDTALKGLKALTVRKERTNVKSVSRNTQTSEIWNLIQKKKKHIIWLINVYSDVKLLEPAVDYALGRHVNLVQSRNESRSVETTLIPLRTILKDSSTYHNYQRIQAIPARRKIANYSQANDFKNKLQSEGKSKQVIQGIQHFFKHGLARKVNIFKDLEAKDTK